MARQIRIEYEGAFYHVMARGNRREKIYRDEEDRGFFMKTLDEVCKMTGWRVHAWVLMSNHYHLLIETPEANLVAGMQWLQNTYTRRFNSRHRQWGRLFGDRYKSVVVEGEGYYYETLLDYIHLNPVRAGIVHAGRGESVLDYQWSSVAAGYALPVRKRPLWLAATEGLEAFGCADTVPGRRRFVERLDRCAMEEGAKKAGVPALPAEADRRGSHLRRGWYWGSQAFGERVLEFAKGKLSKKKSRAYRSSEEGRTHQHAEAERILKEGLAAAGLTTGDLEKSMGSEARKVALAKLIREQTTVSQTWIATHLHMKSAANVSQQIKRAKVSSRGKSLPLELRDYINSVRG
jgi:putative transposase